MKRILLSLYLVLPFANPANIGLSDADAQLSKLVNPFIGTGGHGHTFPGPTMPFGACQLSPDTRIDGSWDGCSGYHYSDSVIYGFSHTHLSGTGCTDYGDILLMPVTKQMALDKYQYASTFSHKNENAHAGYYEVFLNEPQVNVKLTATLHGGVHRYHYKDGSDMYVVLDLKHRDEVLDSKMEKTDDYTIRGYRFSKAWAQNQKVFYEIKFSEKIESITYDNASGQAIENSKHCLIKFQNKKNTGSELIVKCAISGVDEEGAHKNLVAEMQENNFQFYKEKCEKEWEKELSKIQISQLDNSTIRQLNNEEKTDFKSSPSNSQIVELSNRQIIFYSALYHCMIHPSLYNDVDGRYRGRDDKIYNTKGKFDYYTVFSLWDTYRALHPLLTIIDKKRTNDFINTFIKQYEQVGRLPIWELSSNETNCMIGYHVVSVIWDAYNKGIRDYDAEKAYEAMKSIATHFSHYEGEGLNMKLKEEFKKGAADADALESYCKYGYVRSDDSHESVSKTLEYAYDDWCIAQMANALGKEKDYEYYTNRSHNWMNVYDPTTGFMRARKNGCLYEPFSPYTVDNNYTEANAWQYSFYVPHDIFTLSYIHSYNTYDNPLADLVHSMFKADEKTQGREQADITGLIGQYAHGNEPSHNLIYVNTAIDVNYNSEDLKNKIINEFYKNSPDGLIGNEDCGQMSAWLVLNTIGLYPFCPGDNQYIFSTPVFDTVSLSSKNSKIVIQHSGSPKNKYVKSCFIDTTAVDLNNYKKNSSASDIANFCGAYCIDHKVFDRSNIINYTTSTSGAMADVDYREMPDRLQYCPTPFIKSGKRIFKDSLKIQIMNSDSYSKIFYRKDKDKKYSEYNEPFVIHDNETIFFYSSKLFIKNNYRKNTSDTLKYSSPIQTATFTKLPTDRKIILKNEYNKSYHAGGAEGLMDGIYGKLNWRAGDWQGYQGQDVEVIMEFDNPKSIKKLSANFLEDQNSWIFYPKQVDFFVSKDGVQWTLVNEVPTNKSDKELTVTISKFETKYNTFKPEKYKYAKMIARNFGPMPQWHEGRGNPTFVFIDEFEVE